MAKIIINKPGYPPSVSVNEPGQSPTVSVNQTPSTGVFNSVFNQTFG